MRFLLASDNTGCISRYFGVYNREMGNAYRGTFIVNPDFKLVSQEVVLDSVGRNGEELVRKLEALNHARNNPDEVCPANWKPGEDTLKPSEKHVGNIYELFAQSK